MFFSGQYNAELNYNNDSPDILKIKFNFESETGLIFDENIPVVLEEEVISLPSEKFILAKKKIEKTELFQTTHPRSLLRSQSEVKFKQTLTVKKSLLKDQSRMAQSKSSDSVFLKPKQSSKFRKSFNMKPSNFVLNEQTLKIFNNRIKAIRKRKAQSVARERNEKPKKHKLSKLKA